MQNQPEILYVNLNPDQPPIEIESCCMNCFQSGTTKLLLVKIPFFKEIIIQAFNCDKCGYRSNEVTSGCQISDFGQKIEFKVETKKDLSRQIIKSENCMIRIDELDFEIPSTKKANVNTIEGFLANAIEELSLLQPERKQQQPEVAAKIEEFLSKLEDYSNGLVLPFHMVIDDPSGTSFLENPHAPKFDPQIKEEKYKRTIQQLNEMGYYADNALNENDNQKKQDKEDEKDKLLKKLELQKYTVIKNNEEFKKQVATENFVANRLDFVKPYIDDKIKQEVSGFEINCNSCGRIGYQNMCFASVPYFKELIVMSFTCDYCGARSTEVKPGGGISKLAKKLTLYVETKEDMNRDCFKSDSARILIPEAEVEVTYGSLGGVYTTIEGLVEKIVTNLKENCPFFGDSTPEQQQSEFQTFYDKMDKFLTLSEKFTIIIDDPLDNSFIQNPYYPKEDPKVKIEVYPRTQKQNDYFGISDMQTYNYEKK